MKDGKKTPKPRKRNGDVTPHESVDLVNRPGPGEHGDAEKPGARLVDIEEQSGGRSVEEELLLMTNDDDAGGLPNQQVANRGPQRQTKARDLPTEHAPHTER